MIPFAVANEGTANSTIVAVVSEIAKNSKYFRNLMTSPTFSE
jgi:hypothetical protein